MPTQFPAEMSGGLLATENPNTTPLPMNTAHSATSSLTRQQPRSTTKAQKSPLQAEASSSSSAATHQCDAPTTPTEPPQRITSLRPDVSPPETKAMTASEADQLCEEICKRMWMTDLAHMFDIVVSADRRGCIDNKLYSQLLDFFYCFVPMVVEAPRSDPVIVRAGDLQSHRRIMNRFGSGRNITR